MSGMHDELSWFRQLGRQAQKIAGRGKQGLSESKSCTTTPWRSFELADVMEEGLAHEVTTNFITPPPRDASETRLLVERSPDRKAYLLSSEDGEPILLARVARQSRSIDMFVPTGGDPPTAMGPAFTFTETNLDGVDWVLSACRCECCAYMPPTSGVTCQSCKRHLMYIRQTPEEFAGCKMMHMEAEIPPLCPDGKPEIWCTRPRVAGATAAAPEKAFAGAGLCLVSRKPKWSSKLQSLTQDFYGRCNRASAKNIQMEIAGASPRSRKGRPELLHGKIGDDTYVLDYRHPLNMVQAFALAISTKDWN